MKENKSNNLLTSDELCDYLSIEKSYLYRLINEKKLPVFRLGHRSLRFDKNKVTKWLDKSEKGSWK